MDGWKTIVSSFPFWDGFLAGAMLVSGILLQWVDFPILLEQQNRLMLRDKRHPAWMFQLFLFVYSRAPHQLPWFGTLCKTNSWNPKMEMSYNQFCLWKNIPTFPLTFNDSMIMLFAWKTCYFRGLPICDPYVLQRHLVTHWWNTQVLACVAGSNGGGLGGSSASSSASSARNGEAV